MVNENRIPIENKKPIETVYELKDEYKIPSYEEFMKSYENDGNLNYDDLNSGGVGETRGYGPCSWGNPNCECYLPEFISLHLACPAPKDKWPYCTKKEPYSWTHKNCGGYMYISRNIRIECKRCYTEGHWKEWSFACSEHPGRYAGATTDDFLSALGLATNLYPHKTKAIKRVARQITLKIEDEDL